MIHQQSFLRLREAYRSGELSPVDVAVSALTHAECVDRQINAFALLDHDRAIAAARDSEQRWRLGREASPLDGMPVTVKEFAHVRGWPTRRASLTSSDSPVEQSTVFVERLEEGGAVLLGKTRAPEFNWKGVTDSPGWGITRNPWNHELTPGGSSGGCAAAVAAGVVRVSFGSDAGGSVRIPAAFSGVLGLKPSHGRIPMWPVPSAFSGLAHIGPLGASALDLHEALTLVSGPSALDWTSLPPRSEPDVTMAPPLKSLRFGVLAPHRWAESNDESRRGIELTVQALDEHKYALTEVDFDVHRTSLAAKELYRLACAQVIRKIPDRLLDLVDPGLVAWTEPATRLDLSAYFELMTLRDSFGAELAAVFEQVDVLILPTVPISAFAAGRDVPDDCPDQDWFTWNPYTPAFNLLQNPALSYPLWPAGSQMPVGVQLVAPRLQDQRLVQLAHWLEGIFPCRLSPMIAAAA